MDFPVSKISASSYVVTTDGFKLNNDLYKNTLFYAKRGIELGEYSILLIEGGKQVVYAVRSDHEFECSNRGYIRDKMIERMAAEGITFIDIGLCYEDLDGNIRVGNWIVKPDMSFYRAGSPKE